MTSRLQRAFAEAGNLPEEEQDALGEWILAELASDRRWDELFARSTDVLTRLADEALSEHHAGKTKPLESAGP